MRHFSFCVAWKTRHSHWLDSRNITFDYYYKSERGREKRTEKRMYIVQQRKTPKRNDIIHPNRWLIHKWQYFSLSPPKHKMIFKDIMRVSNTMLATVIDCRIASSVSSSCVGFSFSSRPTFGVRRAKYTQTKWHRAIKKQSESSTPELRPGILKWTQ